MSNTKSNRLLMKDADPKTIPLDQIDLSQPDLYEYDIPFEFLKRLRKEDPIHYCAQSEYGPFWSVTKFDHIVHIEKDYKLFSNEPTIMLLDPSDAVPFQSFLQMDPPKHDVQRAAVQGVVAPANLAKLEPIIRRRAGKILDELPIGETFDWVERVSIELTTQMLATLFDFPFEERSKLTYWSDITADINGGNMVNDEERWASLNECGIYFAKLWKERANKPPGDDFISMMIHTESTRDLISKPMEFLGNILLLIVGGNDTTRNSLTGGVLALNQFPMEYDKLRNNHSLIPNMVSEIIRWQTPIMNMRRRATQDTVLFGKQIRKDDKLLLWYLSGNRDEDVIEDADRFIIDRKRARHHISFGFGLHRCMGNRMAEMQLRIVWEEIMKRFHTVEVVSEPKRVRSMMVRGYTELQVRVHSLN